MSYTIPNTFAVLSGNVAASTLDTNFTTLVNAVNNAFLSGSLAARPAADGVGNGRYYYATDQAILYRDNGTAWVQVASPGDLTTLQALSDAATVNWNVSSGNIGTWTIAGNRTISTPTNLRAGSYYTLLITQDATGGRTISWANAYRLYGTLPPLQPIQGANAVTPYLFVSPDGVILRQVNVQTVGILAKSGAATLTPNDTSENILATVNVPSYVLGNNGHIRLMLAWTITNNGNLKTIRVRYSGIAGTEILSQALTNQQQLVAVVVIANRGATNSQVGSQLTTTFTGALSASVATSNVVTTADTTVLITGQKASAGDLLRLEYYVAEIMSDGT